MCGSSLHYLQFSQVWFLATIAYLHLVF